MYVELWQGMVLRSYILCHLSLFWSEFTLNTHVLILSFPFPYSGFRRHGFYAKQTSDVTQ